MASLDTEKLPRPHEEMPSFTLLSTAIRSHGPRLGTLAHPSRRVIQTPNFLANTSRGIVPHVSQDVFQERTGINGVYMAFEDSVKVVEKVPPDVPPVFQTPLTKNLSRLHNFTGLPEDSLIVVGVRRQPPVPTPVNNTNSAFAICTSVGFRRETVEDYISALEKMGPDIVIGPADIVETSNQKRIGRMVDRSTEWMERLARQKDAKSEMERSSSQYALFAPILPVEVDQQRSYLDSLTDMAQRVSGLAFHDTRPIPDLPPSLSQLPRLALTEASGPTQLLSQIAVGVDLFVLPFVGRATDSGVALDFSFPQQNPASAEPMALGWDMWDASNATQLSPLRPGCECYACKSHHRAYMYHLFSAKEMLGWVLLQIHNHHIMDEFFKGIRRSIAQGTFAEDKERFGNYYTAELPDTTGQGPRVRGYQYKSEAGQVKKNPKAFGDIDGLV